MQTLPIVPVAMRFAAVTSASKSRAVFHTRRSIWVPDHLPDTSPPRKGQIMLPGVQKQGLMSTKPLRSGGKAKAVQKEQAARGVVVVVGLLQLVQPAGSR